MFSLNVPEKYSSSIYNTIRPLYISSRFFGILPFSATIFKPSSNEIYLTKLDYSLCVFQELVFIVCTVFNFNVDNHSFEFSSKLLELGMKYHTIVGCIICCILVIVDFIFRADTWEIIESINDFDLKVVHHVL